MWVEAFWQAIHRKQISLKSYNYLSWFRFFVKNPHFSHHPFGHYCSSTEQIPLTCLKIGWSNIFSELQKRHENQKKKLELEFAEMDQKRREFEREKAEFDDLVRQWEQKNAPSDKKKKQKQSLF